MINHDTLSEKLEIARLLIVRAHAKESARGIESLMDCANKTAAILEGLKRTDVYETDPWINP